MSAWLYLLAAGAVLGTAAFLWLRRDGGGSGRRSRLAEVREANRRLVQNPRDPEALAVLASAAFEEQDFPRAFQHYQVLLPLAGSRAPKDAFQVTLRYAQAARNSGKMEEAYQGFLLAHDLDRESFEVSYNLGVLEYGRKNYPRAVGFLRQAAAAQPDHAQTLKYLGHGLFQLKQYKEAAMALSGSLDLEPEDTGAQFALARSYYALSSNEPALAIFSRLRTDPQYGAQSSLFAGTIHMNTKQAAQALEDFAIGLRHPGTPANVTLELKYRKAAVHAREGDIPAALALWKEIMAVQADYRDVRELSARYQEVHSSRHLQDYLLASSADFLSLCRKVAVKYYPGGAAKLLSIGLQRAEYADLLAQVRTPQWEELVLFRFLRTGGSVGELMLRDFYARLKEVRAGRGVCLTAGGFSEQAAAFVEARMIDLVEKEGLVKLFRRI
jgi:tetratricopeptide (TPR) repeat protein